MFEKLKARRREARVAQLYAEVDDLLGCYPDMHVVERFKMVIKFDFMRSALPKGLFETESDQGLYRLGKSIVDGAKFTARVSPAEANGEALLGLLLEATSTPAGKQCVESIMEWCHLTVAKDRGVFAFIEATAAWENVLVRCQKAQDPDVQMRAMELIGDITVATVPSHRCHAGGGTSLTQWQPSGRDGQLRPERLLQGGPRRGPPGDDIPSTLEV